MKMDDPMNIFTSQKHLIDSIAKSDMDMQSSGNKTSSGEKRSSGKKADPVQKSLADAGKKFEDIFGSVSLNSSEKEQPKKNLLDDFFT